MKNKAVFCIAKNLNQAEQIVNQLRKVGFVNEDISILYSEKRGEITSEKGEWAPETKATGFDANRPANVSRPHKKTGALGHEKHSKAPEGAATGAAAGGLIGGTLGLLVGIGSLAIPGMGPFIAAGPIMAAIAGSAVGGSVGLLTGALVGLGIPEYEAVHYAETLKSGSNILISVHTENAEQIDKAKEVFERNGAEDIAYTRETSLPSGKRGLK